VLRIETAYEVRGMVARVRSYDAATSGSVVNEVERVYDDFGLLSKEGGRGVRPVLGIKGSTVER